MPNLDDDKDFDKDLKRADDAGPADDEIEEAGEDGDEGLDSWKLEEDIEE